MSREPAIRLVEPAPDFDSDFRSKLEDLLRWRRDVRRFQTDPLPAGTVQRLVEAARLAPSVGLSEPWRFVVVASKPRKRVMRENFERAPAVGRLHRSGDRSGPPARPRDDAENLDLFHGSARPYTLARGTRRRNWRGLGFDIGDRLAERNQGRSRGLALCRLSLRWLSA